MNARTDRVSLRWQLTATAAAVVLSLIARAPWIGGPFTRDESAAMTVAREMLHGELPNVTAWQQRHPGTYLFYFAASLLPVSSDAQLDVLAAASVACTIAGLAVWLFAACSPKAAAFGLLLYALASCDLSTQGQTANTEILINPLLAWSAALVARWRLGRAPLWGLACAGLLAGASGTIKEHTVLFVALIALTIVWPADGAKPRWKPVFAFSAGAAVPWLLIVVIYAAAGELPVIIETFAFNAGHVQLALGDLPAGPLLLAARTYAAFGTWPLWILALCWIGIWLSRRNVDPTAVAYLAAAVGMIVLPGYFFAHYYLLALPPLVVAAASFLDAVAAASRARSLALAALTASYVAAIQLAFAMGFIPFGVRNLPTIDRYTDPQRRFAEKLGKNCPDATLLLYGIDHQFHLYSRLRPVQPILWLSFYDQRFKRPDSGAKPILDRALRGLERRSPDVVILQEPVYFDDDRPIARRIAALLSRGGYVALPVREVSGDLGFDSYAAMHVAGVYRLPSAARDCRQPQFR